MKKHALLLVVLSTLVLFFGCSNESIYLGDDFSVALIIANRGDMAFYDAAIVGLNKAKEDLDINLTILEHENKPENYEAKFMEAIKAGNEIVIGSSFMKETFEANAQKYPDTTLILFDDEVDWDKGKYENIHCITYRANESSFLGGYIAASLTKTNTIGFLGGLDKPVNNNFLIGYIEGATLYNPDIRIITQYAGGFELPEKGREIAVEMMDAGADVIFNVAGGTGAGLIEAAAQRGKYVIGVDSDQAMMYEAKAENELAAAIVTSVLKDVGHSLYDSIDMFQKQELKMGETRSLGLKEGGVGIAYNHYYEKVVSEDVRNKVAELRKKIEKEELIVSSVHTMTREDLSSLRNKFKPD